MHPISLSDNELIQLRGEIERVKLTKYAAEFQNYLFLFKIFELHRNVE